eukprot:414501_1
MSLSSIFLKSECTERFINYMPKPSHHPHNKDVVIISTNYFETSKGIYAYNIKSNTCNKICTYDKTFKLYNHGQFIDAKSELLYIFGYGKLGIFDLNTKVMN